MITDKIKSTGLYFSLKAVLCFFTGMLLSAPYVSGTYSPFAAAFSTSLSGILSVFSAVGSIIGLFIFQSGISSFRYFAIIFTSTTILNICTNAFGLKKEYIIRPLCPGICTLAVNSVFLLSQKFSPGLYGAVLCETLLSAAAVPVFKTAVDSYTDKLSFVIKENEKTFICISLSISLIFAHLGYFDVIGTCICVFAFLTAIMFFSQTHGFEGGIITGVCCSFVFALKGESDLICPALALCGCLCSFFSISRKYFKAAVCALCVTAACAFGESSYSVPVIISAVAAGVVFCLIPSRFLKSINDEAEEEIGVSSLTVPSKATEAVNAVESLTTCVEAARRTLKPLIAPDLKKELNLARQKVCSSCELFESCVNEIKNPDNPCYQKIADSFHLGSPDFSCFPENFSATCYCADKMLTTMNRAYFVFCTRADADNRINRMQAITGNQLKNIGGIIGGICDSVVNPGGTSRHDQVSACSATEFGIKIKDSRLCTDKAGHNSFNISFDKPDTNFNVTALTEKLCIDTGYELDFPTLVQKDNTYNLIFKQKEKLGFNIAAAVHPGEGKNICGDYYRCFKDKHGRQMVLLSDGMGTGSRAAVDSAFTCETFSNLIKSGIDEKTAVAAVNCAMMMKSTDESVSTVDLVRIDPVLCKADFFKCGAAASFILKNGKPQIIESESAPIGILDSVNMNTSSVEIAKGDIILTVSDGVCSERYNWICNELRSWKSDNATGLARHILQCALDRTIGKRCDDMSVIAVCII